jgi:hypothetical protein
MAAQCSTDKSNLALSKCNKLPKLIKGMIETPADFSFSPADIASAAAFKTALQALLIEDAQADRGYLWPFFFSFENNSEETVFEETPLGRRAVRDGQYRFNFNISENICLHKAMFSHRTTQGRVFLIDSDNQILGTVDTDGNFLGFTISMVHTGKFIFNDGSVVTKSPIFVDLLDNTELDRDGEILSGDIGKVINQVIRLADATLEIVGTPSATTIVVDVYAECDGTEIAGLVTADFTLTDDDNGASHAFTAAESSTIPGRYTLTGTSFEDSHVNLVGPTALTIKAWESTGSVAVNVP